jgi:holo-[acyl-carrier protein] synthase
MIVGIGIDILELVRIEKILARQEAAFLARIFTERERECIPEAERRKIEFVAGRYAAKEAAAKAVGTGIGKQLSFQDIEIVPEESGRPQLFINPERLEEIIGYQNCYCHLSISHSEQYAVAQVIMEKR